MCIVRLHVLCTVRAGAGSAGGEPAGRPAGWGLPAFLSPPTATPCAPGHSPACTPVKHRLKAPKACPAPETSTEDAVWLVASAHRPIRRLCGGGGGGGCSCLLATLRHDATFLCSSLAESDRQGRKTRLHVYCAPTCIVYCARWRWQRWGSPNSPNWCITATQHDKRLTDLNNFRAVGEADETNANNQARTKRMATAGRMKGGWAEWRQPRIGTWGACDEMKALQQNTQSTEGEGESQDGNDREERSQCAEELAPGGQNASRLGRDVHAKRRSVQNAHIQV